VALLAALRRAVTHRVMGGYMTRLVDDLTVYTRVPLEADSTCSGPTHEWH
jgi:hypothetical protein